MIEIEDAGVGIPEEDLPNIFVDFMKVRDHKNINPQGTGLGLSICKMIVEKMRGQIKVESKENVGTTFKVIIGSKAYIPEKLKVLGKIPGENSLRSSLVNESALSDKDAFKNNF